MLKPVIPKKGTWSTQERIWRMPKANLFLQRFFFFFINDDWKIKKSTIKLFFKDKETLWRWSTRWNQIRIVLRYVKKCAWEHVNHNSACYLYKYDDVCAYHLRNKFNEWKRIFIHSFYTLIIIVHFTFLLLSKPKAKKEKKSAYNLSL